MKRMDLVLGIGGRDRVAPDTVGGCTEVGASCGVQEEGCAGTRETEFEEAVEGGDQEEGGGGFFGEAGNLWWSARRKGLRAREAYPSMVKAS